MRAGMRASYVDPAGQRRREIEALRREIRDARKVLAQAESQTSLSKKQLQELNDRLAASHDAVSSARPKQASSQHIFEGIEAQILEDEGPDSKIGRAKTAMEEAHKAAEREFYRVLGRSHAGGQSESEAITPGSLSKDEEKRLKQDAAYQSAVKKLKRTEQDYAALRREVVEQSAEWIAAKEAAREKSERNEKKHESGKGKPSSAQMSIQRELHNAKDLAAVARKVIAQDEARLRQLGVNPALDPSLRSTPRKTTP